MKSAEQTTLWHATQAPKALSERPLSQWPSELHPTNRLHENGAAALSDAELLALILGAHGVKNPVLLASELIASFAGLTGIHRASIEDLTRQPGMNRQKAAQIKAALEMGRRLLLAGLDERKQIRSPTDAANLLMLEMSHLDQEHLRVICVDTKNRVQKIHTVYVGSLNSSIVRVGEVFKEAIRLNSAAIIVVHNHPSGDPTPSPEDVLVTRHIVDAGKLLDIEVLDHLIIGHGRFVSMRERNLGFPG